jgi:hypothetical protein
MLNNFWHVLCSLGRPREATIIAPSADAALVLGATLDQKRTGLSSREKGRPNDLAPLAPPNLLISPAFKLVVWLVFAVIVLCGASMILLAINSRPENEALAAASNAMSTAFTASLGALLGLLGGKSIA